MSSKETCITDCDERRPETCEKNDSGTTCFSGNVGIDCRRKLLVNEIDPVKMVLDESCSYECPGECFYRCANDYDSKAITCFSGNVGINPNRKLLVKRIDPVTEWCASDKNREYCSEVNCDPSCCEDEACDAAICFSGHIGMDECKKVRTNFITPVKGEDCLDNSAYGVTCFCGNVGVEKSKSLFVNRICPVQDGDDICCPTYRDGYECCETSCKEDGAGCLELCGGQVIVPGKLLVNDICPFKCDGRDGIAGDEFLNFSSNVAMKRDLEVNGDLFVDGALLYSAAPRTRAHTDSRAIVRSLIDGAGEHMNVGELTWHLAQMVQDLDAELAALKGNQ